MIQALSFTVYIVTSLCLVAEAQLPVLVKCKTTKSGFEFGAKGKDCSPEAQKVACAKYDTDPQLGPSLPTGCTTFTSIDALTTALTNAALSRDPKAAATLQALAQPASDPEKIPAPGVGIKCKLRNPKPGQNPLFAAVTAIPDPKRNPDICGNAQLKCDSYKDSPQLGPADYVGPCKTFKNLKEYTDWVQSFVDLGIFPGNGGSMITCKTRDERIEYNVPVAKTPVRCSDTEGFKQACQTADGIADPVPNCKTFVSDQELIDELNKKPKLYGLECQFKVGGFGKREVVPECSNKIKELLCPSADLDITSCTKFPTNDAAVAWSKEFFNVGLVNCQTTGGLIVQIPSRDCSSETQRRACPKNMTPIGCARAFDVEKLKQIAAESKKKRG